MSIYKMFISNNKLIINKYIKIVLILVSFSLPISTTLTNILLTLFMLLWILEGDYKTKLNNVWLHPACFAPIILIFSLIIGSLYSYASWPDIISFLKKISKLLYIPFMIFYFKEPQQRTKTINAFIIAGTITSILGLIFNDYSPLKNTIDTSLIATITTFLLLYKINNINKLIINISILSISLLNIFYLFYVSKGRTAQIIFILLIITFCIQKIKQNFNKIAIILIALLLILCGVYSNRLQSEWLTVLNQYQTYQNNSRNHDRNSVSERLVFYKNTILLIKQKPWFGWGTGSFRSIYQQLSIKNNTFTTNNPHNEYLLWGTQLGMFGIGLLLWWFYILFKTSFIIIPEYEKHLLQVTIICIMIGCLANSWLMDFVSGNLFVMLISIALGALPNVKSKRTSYPI